jgi:hypothetical protein
MIFLSRRHAPMKEWNRRILSEAGLHFDLAAMVIAGRRTFPYAPRSAPPTLGNSYALATGCAINSLRSSADFPWRKSSLDRTGLPGEPRTGQA